MDRITLNSLTQALSKHLGGRCADIDGQVHEVAQVHVTCIILNIFYNMDIYGHNFSLDDGSFYLLISIISMKCTGVLCRWLLSFACRSTEIRKQKKEVMTHDASIM